MVVRRQVGEAVVVPDATLRGALAWLEDAGDDAEGATSGSHLAA